LSFVTVGLIIFWLLDFVVVVLPALQTNDVDSLCPRNDQQIEHYCYLIVGSFCTFIVVRILVHSDHCFGQVREQAECGLLGPVRLLIFGMAVHGTLYVFCATSALFVAQLIYTSKCEASNPLLYSACQTFAFLSCLVGNFCVSLVFWRGQLVHQATQRLAFGRGKQRASSGAIEQIAAVPYDPVLFGDEDDRRYAKECPICLGVWEPEDDIRAPPCGHAYHKECLGRWLQTDRTCALCRRDVAAPGND